MTAGGRLPIAVRLFHWGIAAAVVLNAVVLEHGSLPHSVAGISCVAMVVARLFWKRSAAHFNPAAAYVYGAIWLAIGALGATGWMMGMDVFWGNPWIGGAHRYTVYLLGLLVAAHLAGITLDAWRHKRKSWMRMIDGR